MPLYEYVCNDCDRHFDVLVRTVSNAPEVACESCSGGNVRRLISSFATVGGFDDQMTAGDFNVRSGGCCGGSCGCGH